MSQECSVERPWGIHPNVRNDENCPRCGWTAPGPLGDAMAHAKAALDAAAARARADRVAGLHGTGGRALAA
ncbi:hypothetical protein E2493_18385 [Sphingomonas parva]|uniref:Uncharacterized protein n=1 Tax=Sphingomonas parva TaxID=2555898 RepID=A0A4Y8ZLA2_9SPHN|nr:hypothetical protein [Sphingomonas parva]TFI56800.1 hypothetical protein E2493_18385 [Sphingomonas parva]